MSGSILRRSAVRRAALIVAAVTVLVAPAGLAQPASERAPNALTVLSREGRRPLSTTVVNGQEMVALDDLGRMFQLTVREDTLAGGLTVSADGRTLVFSTTQGLASATGRLVSLSGPPVRHSRGWLVPLDALSRALPLVLGTRLDVRRGSRLVVVGDLRVPRVEVRTDAAGSQLRVVLDIVPVTPHTIEPSPGRLVVRFDADALDATLPTPPRGDLLASVGVLDTGTAIGLDLGPAFVSYRATDAAGDRDGTRLTIELLSAAASTRAEAPPSPAPAPLPPAQPPPPLFAPPTSALRTIVIDPGHGGEETGARGPAGTFEKDIALAVARQLKGLLEARLGVRVLLTRDGDDTVPLDERAAVANNNKADVFVSLHANASVRESARGAEVFYLSAGEYNAEARQQAAIEGELLPVVGGGDRKVELILWEMAQLQHLEDSGVLATMVELQLRELVPMSPRAIQQAPFRVLVGANTPAVLVEMGFVTNPDEEKRLASPAHQATIAQALYQSLVRFKSYLESGRRPVAAGDGQAGQATATGQPTGTPPPGDR